MRYFLWLLMVGLLVGSLGCESFEDVFNDDDDDDNNRQAVVTRTMSANDFVREAASAGMFEVQSAQLLLDRNVGGDEETFAREMLNEHNRANEELRRIAENNRIPVPPDMMAKHRQMLDRLRDANDAQLTQRYHQMQVQAHEDAVNLFQRASNQLDNPDLRDYAARTLPTLREHRNDLRQHRHN